MQTVIRWFKDVFTPNTVPSTKTWVAIWIVLAFHFVAYWSTITSALTPTPLEVIQSFPTLWFERGLGDELMSSYGVNLSALFWSILIALPLGYICRVPALEPLSFVLAKLRFVSPIVFYALFAEAMHSGHAVKVGLLTLGEVVFLITTVVGIVVNIPEIHFDDARTLRMSEWKSIWYVVVRGTLPQVIDAIRDNAAMGWSMLMMVEANMRSEGGVGVLIMNNEKHLQFAEVYMMALVIVAVGIGQDYLIGQVRKVACPYAH